MTIFLHKLDASPPARAVMMAVEILGLDVKLHEIDFFGGEHMKPEYVAKNPLHTVPLLEDGDFVLADSHAIIIYLFSKYAAKQREQWFPNDLRVRATIQQRLFFDASVLFPRLRAVIARLLRDKLKGITTQQVADIKEAYNFVEKYLESTPYLVGDNPTLADVSCISTISSLNSLVPIDEKYAKTKEWWDRLKTEDWYEKGNAVGLLKFDGLIKQLNGGAAPVVVES